MHVLSTLNTYVKFCVNWMLFTIWSINLFFMHNLNYKNLKFKHLTDNIAIDLWFFGKFVNMWVIRRKRYPIVDLSKFISNKKYWWSCSQICSNKYIRNLIILSFFFFFWQKHCLFSSFQYKRANNKKKN